MQVDKSEAGRHIRLQCPSSRGKNTRAQRSQVHRAGLQAHGAQRELLTEIPQHARLCHETPGTWSPFQEDLGGAPRKPTPTPGGKLPLLRDLWFPDRSFLCSLQLRKHILYLLLTLSHTHHYSFETTFPVLFTY